MKSIVEEQGFHLLRKDIAQGRVKRLLLALASWMEKREMAGVVLDLRHGIVVLLFGGHELPPIRQRVLRRIWLCQSQLLRHMTRKSVILRESGCVKHFLCALVAALCPFPPQESVVAVSYEVRRRSLSLARAIGRCGGRRRRAPHLFAAGAFRLKGGSYVPLASLLR